MAKTKAPKPPTVTQTNFSTLKTYGGKVAEQVTSFARIRTVGDKNTAITVDGEKVERQDMFYCEGYGMVKTAPYESHFIYQDPLSMDNHPRKRNGRWAFMCTCGSIAGIVSYKELSKLMTIDGTESGYILVCNAHTTAKQKIGIGKHADGVQE